MLTGGVQITQVAPLQGRGVEVSYQVDQTRPGSPLYLGVYRSADAQLDQSDVYVGSAAASLTAGTHQESVTLEGGLSPVPKRPYVIVAAQDDAANHQGEGSTLPTGSYRTYSVAVVSHGGLQNPDWASIPRWQGLMAEGLRNAGYDRVIPFNWVAVSNKPGYAAGQGRRLAREISQAVAELPAGAAVDLHVIGHSEGAVVTSQALQRLDPETAPGLKDGYLRVTLLDPHAANTGVAGQQYSVGDGPLGWLAKGLIDDYQAEAKDPPVIYPSRVNQIEVFYQHSFASRGDSSNRHIYNLWGQVPLRQPADYFDLTQAGVTHAGSFGVPVWYQRNVVPTLGEGEPAVTANILTAALDPADSWAGHSAVAATHAPTFTGQAAPGATVHLLAAPADEPGDLAVVGRATADASGAWSLTTQPLRDGRYRLLARALPPKTDPSVWLPMVPTTPMGGFSIKTRRA